MSDSFLPYGRQLVDNDDIERVVEVLKGDFLTTGPTVAEFEEKLARLAGAKHAVAVNSGTSALHCAYFAAGLGEDDELITSPMTFAATSNAALYLGASVKFVDVQPETGNIDPDQVKDSASERTKVIAPIDFAGTPADYDELRRIARDNEAVLVSDSAHSLGATYRDEPVGAWADLSEISMHPVKPITTGEGGAVLTNREEFATRAARFRTHGVVRELDELRKEADGPWYYEMQDLGFNYRLTDIQCALGLGQLEKLDRFIQRRREIASRYAEALKDESRLTLPPMPTDRQPGWHLYVVRVKEASRRRAFFERLRELGLGVQVHYIPVHMHPYYKKLGFEKGQFPVAEEYYSRAVSLPIFPAMTDDDVDSSIERVLKAANDAL
jgi:UDP-4-amino-4,6-dideoxy-N-acetyl-beta-L-altrosamine transaminase